MPLSEHERKIIDELEDALAAPSVVPRPLRAGRVRPGARLAICATMLPIAVLSVLAGVLMAGIAGTLLGVAGYVLIVVVAVSGINIRAPLSRSRPRQPSPLSTSRPPWRRR